VSPPSGRLVDVQYKGGDRFRVEFFDLLSMEDLVSRYPDVNSEHFEDISFPVTAVEIWEKVAGTNIEFGPRETRVPGGVMRGCLSSGDGAAIYVDAAPSDLARMFPSSSGA
jgi:hypothetical protein